MYTYINVSLHLSRGNDPTLSQIGEGGDGFRVVSDANSGGDQATSVTMDSPKKLKVICVKME